MPGIFAQTVVFACVTTAIGMTDDVNKGILDRFRSLPMARSAVLTGRTLFDLIYQACILVVLMLSGLAVGWRVHTSVPEFFAGVGLLLLFTFSMSWVGVYMGLSVRTVEAANQIGFTVLFPLTFVSNVFVPTETLPNWLQPYRGVEPGQHPDGLLPRAVGQPQPVCHGRLPGRAPHPPHPRLDRLDCRGLRSHRRPPLPRMSRSARRLLAVRPYHRVVLPPPAILAVGLLLALLVLIPRDGSRWWVRLAHDRALRLRHVAPGRPLLAVRRARHRFLIPIFLIGYIAPFVAALHAVARFLRRGRGGPGTAVVSDLIARR